MLFTWCEHAYPFIMLLVCATRDINFDVLNMTLYVIYLHLWKNIICKL